MSYATVVLAARLGQTLHRLFLPIQLRYLPPGCGIVES